MNLLARIRSRQARWGRRSLALISLAWLNLVLQPCAMALAGDQHPACPHCPTTAMPDHSSHAATSGHGHDMADAGHAHGHDHGQQMPADDGAASDHHACMGQVADCANLDDINSCEREEPIIPEAPLVWLAPPPGTTDQAIDPGPLPWSDSVEPALLAGAGPPLNVRYCVYLD